jgi:hypothetical protein
MSPDLELAKSSLKVAMANLVSAEQDGYGSRELSITKTKIDEAILWLEHMMRAQEKEGS